MNSPVVGTFGPQSPGAVEPSGPIAMAFNTRLVTDEHYDPRDVARVWRAVDQVVAAHDAKPAGGQTAVALIGRVQSGKTTGMLASICALADRGISLFVVLTGMKTSLDEQTTDDVAVRIQDGVEGPDWHWLVTDLDQASDLDREADSIVRGLNRNASGSGPRFLSIVLGIKQNLNQVQALLDRIEYLRSGSLDGNAVLFDDEADQGSPDVRRRRAAAASTTNANIATVRSRLGSHTYIPVTATPQALLVQEWRNAVRPAAAALLEPGSKYVGGVDLFGPAAGTFAQEIPPADAAAVDNMDLAPPESLMESLATFFLTCALVEGTTGVPNPISMLIHPHRYKNQHEHVHSWVDGLTARWGDWDESSITNEGDVESCFRQAAAILATTCREDMTSLGFSSQGEGLVRWVLAAVHVCTSPLLRIVTVNDDHPWTERWRRGYWILIGGDVLGRGFVVNGLTTTYMSRELARTPTYDTVQQRGRFFGYKRDYERLLRGWFPRDLAEIFEQYLEHEDLLWDFLDQRIQLSEPLNETLSVFQTWGNALPTRRLAVRGTLSARRLRGSWWAQTYAFDDRLASNVGLFQRWTSGLGGSVRWHPPAFQRPVDYEAWLCQGDSLRALLEDWSCRSVDMAWRTSILSRLENHDTVRVVDLTTRQGARPPAARSYQRKVAANWPGSGDPWDDPDRARINNWFSNPTGAADQDAVDDASTVTVLYRPLEPQPCPGSRQLPVGTLAIRRDVAWGSRAAVIDR